MPEPECAQAGIFRGAPAPFIPIADLAPCGIPGQRGKSFTQKAWSDKRLDGPVASRAHGTRDALVLAGQ